MKNLIFGLTTTLCLGISFMVNAQKKATIFDTAGKELVIAVDIQKDNSFENLFILQYNEIENTAVLQNKEFNVLHIDKRKIKLRSEDVTYIFTINDDEVGTNEIAFRGYGLSHRKGKFTLILNSQPPTHIGDLILIDNQSIPETERKCYSGGEGASECSVKPSSLSVGKAECSVTCKTGYYACCNDVAGECGCVKE